MRYMAHWIKKGFLKKLQNMILTLLILHPKQSSDHFVRAFYDTYRMPVVISNCSNNYGSYQVPEKLIPLFINNIVNNKPLPVYGKGENVRDWLFVNDHVRAIDIIFHTMVNWERLTI